MTKQGTLVRLGVDFGAPAAFVLAYMVTKDMLDATWWLVGGSALALLAGWIFERRVAPLPLVAGLAAIIFGGLALAFHDEVWVKVKPTVINLLFAAFLLGGVAMRKLPLKMVLGEVIKLPDAMWRNLSIRYGVYFLLIAIVNEVVWRTQSDSVWAVFRFPGLQLMALVFSATQFPLMLKGAKLVELEEASREG